ncbi:hypothetical protein ACFWTE_16485 [Nocardiopsis sp. NPDC058631]|uniref:hypothetical protein n=1 Tax=Nocardiopsis sp. NPDC058631 TaxID=3346566 RepID=UPI00364BC770
MGTQPTPEEAASALNEVAERREQAASTNAHPVWTLWVIGAGAIGFGLASDLWPERSTELLYLFATGALLLVFLPRWKRPGSAMGYQSDPRPVGISARGRALRALVMLALMAVFAAGAVALRSWDVPYPTTIASFVVVVTMPLWHRLLNRAARDPKV